jgi:CubicO group peptidase (beta-lactamase class C family)
MKNRIFLRPFLLISGALLTGCVTATANSPSDYAMAQRAKMAAARVAQTYDADGPGAAYLISYEGEILVSGAVGMADLEWGIQLNDKTPLRLGSISKPITSIAVLQLAEKGVIDIDKPISAYAADLPAQMGAVTMRQLMSHRSGLTEHVFNPDILPFVWQPMTTQQIIDLQKDKPIDFPPGEKYNYVNFNYALIAHIIEQVTGRTYIDFIDSEIFAAQGMPDSHYDVHDTIMPRRPEFYDQRDGVIYNAQDVDLSHASAAGALMSSAKDMAHWAQLLVENKLVSAATLQEAWTAAPLPDGAPTKYGLGFNIGELAGERLIWHNGLSPGSQAAFSIAPDAGLFVIVLSNGFYTPNTTDMIDEMMTIMITGAMPVEPTP